MTTQFVVRGPFEVRTTKLNAGRTITTENVKVFWEEHPDEAWLRGCYVFAMRAGRGLTPGYVGKATKTFKQEVFTPQKVMKYQQFLARYRRGAPVMFFIEAPKKRGLANGRHIAGLEAFLIQVAAAANSELLNVQGTKEADWSIQGVLRSKGKPSKEARALKRTLNL